MLSRFKCQENAKGRKFRDYFQASTFPNTNHQRETRTEPTIHLPEVPKCTTVLENNCILCVCSIYIKIKSPFNVIFHFNHRCKNTHP